MFLKILGQMFFGNAFFETRAYCIFPMAMAQRTGRSLLRISVNQIPVGQLGQPLGTPCSGYQHWQCVKGDSYLKYQCLNSTSNREKPPGFVRMSCQLCDWGGFVTAHRSNIVWSQQMPEYDQEWTSRLQTGDCFIESRRCWPHGSGPLIHQIQQTTSL